MEKNKRKDNNRVPFYLSLMLLVIDEGHKL